ncbi:hypothetical protein ACH5RR_020604 [Cinchona calisaya]|uniref:Uncharacterized protein n=1 Tax=Cinchona calisaya TaxID=153742 RepID=A0ABD2ZEY5_9GENT
MATSSPSTAYLQNGSPGYTYSIHHHNHNGANPRIEKDVKLLVIEIESLLQGEALLEEEQEGLVPQYALDERKRSVYWLRHWALGYLLSVVAWSAANLSGIETVLVNKSAEKSVVLGPSTGKSQESVLILGLRCIPFIASSTEVYTCVSFRIGLA